MSMWFGAWREDGIVPDDKKPGEDEFFMQVRFRHLVKREDDDDDEEETGDREEEEESLTVKSFRVKRSAVSSPTVESVNVLFDMLRLVGVHPKVSLMCPMIREICSFARKRTGNEHEATQIEPFVFGIGLVDFKPSTTTLSKARLPPAVMECLLDDLQS